MTLSSGTRAVEGNLNLAIQAILLRSQEHPTLFRTAVLLSTALIIWRLWKFTLYPILHPTEPKELPSWIPSKFSSHGFAFFHNSQAFLAKATKAIGGKDPFAVTVFGSHFYIITQPKQTIEVYKNVDSLSFEEFLIGLMKYLNLTDHTLQAVFETRLPRDKPGFPNPDGKALGHFVRDMHHRQLYPGANLDTLEAVMVQWFDRYLHLDALQTLCAPYSTSSSSSSSPATTGEANKASIEVPLVKWCSELFTRAGEQGYFGDSLAALDPDMATTFLVYDELSWQVLYQYPRVFSRQMHAAMDRVQQTFVRYFRIPQAEREAQGGAWFTTAIENECRSLGIEEQDMARFMVMVYWVVSTNTRKAAYWILYYLLHDKPDLIEAIRQETAPAFDKDGKLVDLAYLHGGQCRNLEQAWLETLRLSANSASARVLTRDTVVGGKLLRRGGRILIPYRLLHFNKAGHGNTSSSGDDGPDINSFRPERFAGRESITRGPSWRPFGGGKTMCPGHFVAKRETMIFVAMVLQRFHVELVGDGVLQPDLGKPVLGLADRKSGQEVTLRITPRTM
ncbi:cytochrome P450 [Lasiosphaeria miniovina]|uniref:Cytochrome P450 n=1 Tax=Lasiosphaeria miniovina TaxID=1954250 RepID=A0AA40A658_9PEZI|nr:cytochrome P450 [Lasiosphaeria miniovina]KAK0710021.1 cytochrome P450 [Lasiosphaeria miniovina]